jgi:hypothetical protein
MVPLGFVALSENCYGSLPTMSKVLLAFPSATEWPLFFTTLRIVMSSVTN